MTRPIEVVIQEWLDEVATSRIQGFMKSFPSAFVHLYTRRVLEEILESYGRARCCIEVYDNVFLEDMPYEIALAHVKYEMKRALTEVHESSEISGP